MNVNKIHYMQLLKLLKAHFERKIAGEMASCKELSLLLQRTHVLGTYNCLIVSSAPGTSNASGLQGHLSVHIPTHRQMEA